MSLHSQARALLVAGEEAVLVTVERADGSTPREPGAQMLVTARGYHGTIGGGTLEWLALAEAQAMFGAAKSIRRLTKSLGPDLGQCCGGRVVLRLEPLDIESQVTRPELTHLNLWGAGHVGRALVMALAPLPFAVSWWDERPGAFPAQVPENTTCCNGAMQDMAGGFVLVMTHSHALDFDLVDFALRHSQFPQVGLIGSETKAARFRKRLAEAGHGPAALARLHCPIGSKTIASKLPAAIAASIVVQMLEWQEMLKTAEMAAPLAQLSGKA